MDKNTKLTDFSLKKAKPIGELIDLDGADQEPLEGVLVKDPEGKEKKDGKLRYIVDMPVYLTAVRGPIPDQTGGNYKDSYLLQFVYGEDTTARLVWVNQEVIIKRLKGLIDAGHVNSEGFFVDPVYTMVVHVDKGRGYFDFTNPE